MKSGHKNMYCRLRCEWKKCMNALIEVHPRGAQYMLLAGNLEMRHLEMKYGVEHGINDADELRELDELRETWKRMSTHFLPDEKSLPSGWLDAYIAFYACVVRMHDFLEMRIATIPDWTPKWKPFPIFGPATADIVA